YIERDKYPDARWTTSQHCVARLLAVRMDIDHPSVLDAVAMLRDHVRSCRGPVTFPVHGRLALSRIIRKMQRDGRLDFLKVFKSLDEFCIIDLVLDTEAGRTLLDSILRDRQNTRGETIYRQGVQFFETLLDVDLMEPHDRLVSTVELMHADVFARSEQFYHDCVWRAMGRDEPDVLRSTAARRGMVPIDTSKLQQSIIVYPWSRSLCGAGGLTCFQFCMETGFLTDIWAISLAEWSEIPDIARWLKEAHIAIPDASAQDFLSRALREAFYANGPLNLDASQFLQVLKDLDLDVNTWSLQLQRDINERAGADRIGHENSVGPHPYSVQRGLRFYVLAGGRNLTRTSIERLSDGVGKPSIWDKELATIVLSFLRAERGASA
ncbi:hypothetical protein HKX48_008668, partial [Thoreauomyces humboldtii]